MMIYSCIYCTYTRQFFIALLLIGTKLLYNVMLVLLYSVNQIYVYIYLLPLEPHPSPLPSKSQLSRSS